MRGPTRIILLAISVVCMFAFTAASASATKVKTGSGAAGTEVSAALTSPFASFTPDSGTSSVTVECKKSTAKGPWPPDTQDKPSTINTVTEAGGSVADDLTTTPTFTECTTAGAATTVATNSTNGLWSGDWQVLNNATSPWNEYEIGVPKGGAVISITGTSCKITVSPKEASSVTGYYKNGSATTESSVAINEEIPFEVTTGCEPLGLTNADSPAAYHGIYSISAQAGAGGVIEEF